MDELCKKIHKKYIITINGEDFCEKCDWGYLDNFSEEELERMKK